MKRLTSFSIFLLLFVCLAIPSMANSLDATLTVSDYNGSNVSCFNAKDGWITCTPTGGTPPYAYKWSIVDTTQTINQLAASYYSVRVTDAVGSTVETGVTLKAPDEIVISHNITPSACYHCFNGAISITANGGNPPYSFLWSDGPTYENRSGLGSGQYQILVTDIFGCSTESDLFPIDEPGRDDWALAGTTGSNPSSQFLGTIDSIDLVVRTHNNSRLRIAGNGAIKIPGFSGSSSRMMLVGSDGTVTPGEPYTAGPPVISPCVQFPTTSPFGLTTITNSWGGIDVTNCNQRFGFGVQAPKERIHLRGYCRFTAYGSSDTTNYLNIGFDGDSKIDNYGTGKLLLNQDSPKDVKICTGSSARGDVVIGGNAYLSTLSGKVGIGTTSPSLTLEIRHTDAIGGMALTNSASGANVHSEIRFLKDTTVKWSIGNDLSTNGKQNFFIWDHFKTATRFFIDSAGKTGIGTTTPSLSLDVLHSDASGGMALTNAASGSNVHSEIRFLKNATVKWSIGNDIGTVGSQNYFIRDESSSVTRFFIDSAGRTGIGMTNPTARLDIYATGDSTRSLVVNKAGTTNFLVYGNGTVYAREVFVKLGTLGDFVFDKKHTLMPIFELKKFIEQNHHLPGIPSKDEVASKGMNVGEFQNSLLQKVEEQALYIIDLQKQIDQMKERIDKLTR